MLGWIIGWFLNYEVEVWDVGSYMILLINVTEFSNSDLVEYRLIVVTEFLLVFVKISTFDEITPKHV